MGNCLGSRPAADPNPTSAITVSTGESTQGLMLVTFSDSSIEKGTLLLFLILSYGILFFCLILVLVINCAFS